MTQVELEDKEEPQPEEQDVTLPPKVLLFTFHTVALESFPQLILMVE